MYWMRIMGYICVEGWAHNSRYFISWYTPGIHILIFNGFRITIAYKIRHMRIIYNIHNNININIKYLKRITFNIIFMIYVSNLWAVKMMNQEDLSRQHFHFKRYTKECIGSFKTIRKSIGHVNDISIGPGYLCLCNFPFFFFDTFSPPCFFCTHCFRFQYKTRRLH